MTKSKNRDHPEELTFDVTGVYDALWGFAGSLRDDSSWLLKVRDGLRGMYSRIIAVDTNYTQLHRYQDEAPEDGNPNEWGVYCESYAAVVLFGMDSTLECFVYVMNAFGFKRSPADFCDINDPKGLRQIGPANIVGDSRSGPKPGYQKFFPQVVAHWQKHADLIAIIVEHHDVTKHRCATMTGGANGALRLRSEPKRPGSAASSTDYTLESLTHEFQVFLEELLTLAWIEICAAFGFEGRKRVH